MLTLLATVLYLLAAATLWQAAMLRDGARARLPTAFAVGALLVHTVDLSAILRNEGGYALTIGDALSLWGWVIALTTFIAAAIRPLRGLPSFLYAIVAGLASFAAVPRTYHEAASPGIAFNAHIVLSMLAAGWLSIAAVCAVLLVAQSARLKARRLDGWIRALPPLEVLDGALFSALAGGFVALTATLFTGLVFVYDLQAQHLSHKLVLSVLAWVLFATLLFGRLRYGWRGRTAARFTVGGFFAIALAYVGAKFVLEVMLGRHWG